MAEVWAIGDSYEPYVGRWSRRVAPLFLDWLAVPSGVRWLDIGCGTGALTGAILERCAPSEVLAIDASKGFLDYAKTHVDDPRVRFEVLDAAHAPAGVADIVVSGLVVNFVPDLPTALAAMQAAAPGGLVAAYVWDYAGRMELIRYFWDAAAALDHVVHDLDEGMRFPICQPHALANAWTEAGFVEVTVQPIEIGTHFVDFDDYWSPFLLGQGPAPGYAMSLDDERRRHLRDAIRDMLPTAPDGSIDLVARAWAVRGQSPA